jgi:hypothetical protein
MVQSSNDFISNGVNFRLIHIILLSMDSSSMALPYMTPQFRKLFPTSWIILGGSTTTSPRVTTVTRRLSNNHDITPAVLGVSAISSSTIWWFPLSQFGGFYFGSTFSLHSETLSRIDSVVSNKLSVSF